MQHLPDPLPLPTHTTWCSFSLIKKKKKKESNFCWPTMPEHSIACLPWSVVDDAPPLLARGGTLWSLSPSLCWDYVSLNLYASCTGCNHLWLRMCINPTGSGKWCFLEAIHLVFPSSLQSEIPELPGGKGVIKISHPGLSAPKSLPSACCLSVVWVSAWLYPLLQGASILRAEQCIDLHGIPGYLQMKIESVEEAFLQPHPYLNCLSTRGNHRD